jgi:predicted DNA-binding protein YlxM (UPF0122 family)
MHRSQGRYFSPEEINKIICFLRNTDMSLPTIASRMGCSRSAVAAINRKYGIRDYEGKRSRWSVSQESKHEEVQV